MLTQKLTKTAITSVMVFALLLPLGLVNTVNSLLGNANVNDTMNVGAGMNNGMLSTGVSNQASAGVLGTSVGSTLGLTAQTGL